ncbi:DUF4272 domain-containing protein [Niabella sp. W65]|nr:DUF4272 domain-containing protein [Niabella sp. W65]MCH7369331.1 DUF4272 domain-containing protein [Niabella sp. W65]
MKSAAERKSGTEKLLRELNIPYLDHLPLIEEEHEAVVRTAPEIAERILILTYLNYVSEVPGGASEVIAFLKTNDLWDKVWPDEKELFQKEKLTRQEEINISWRTEAIWLLLWAINKVEELALPTQEIASADILERLPEFLSDPSGFISEAMGRPISAILDMSDLVYRLHWATKNANLNNEPMPAGLNLGIIMERHYAINWLTYYADEWDSVILDT